VYLRAVAAPGAQRHDLEGRPVAEVSEKERMFAEVRLRTMREQRHRRRRAHKLRMQQQEAKKKA
jgi:sRNA-binding protein